MARKKNQEITRRTVTAQRQSEAPSLRVQADLDSSRGYSALGSAASEVFGKLGQVASRINADRTATKFNEDKTQGAKDRSVESLAGTPSATPETLTEKTAGYRRGYFMTEAANRLHTTKMEVAAEAAKLEPGEDITPLLQERFTAMLTAPEFQDPEVMRALQPAIQKAQEDIGVARQKTELAEVFERQSENFRTMARDGIRDGSLRTPQGVKQFRAMLDTEPFAYLDRDEADDIISEQYAELFSTGEIDPETAMEFLKTPLEKGETPLIDRAGWQDKFQAAIAAGAAIRQKQFEEKQAEYLSTIEYGLQQRAARGALSESTIMAEADKAGMQGKDRLTFVRRWIDQNDAGLKHMQSEANRAREHKETIAAINAGNALMLTDSKLTKSAEKEWATAVASGDSATKQRVIERYTRAGIVIPQLKDMLGRTTERNLTANYNLYSELAKIDRVAADRYLSEDNASLFAQHHDNITQFGMTPEESIQAIPTGATKGRRKDVAAEISTASTRYFKDNPTMSDGTPRTRGVQAAIEQQAIRLGLRNPNATAEVNLKTAERLVMGSTIVVNGQRVPMGGARPTAVPAIEAFAKESAAGLVEAGVIPPEMKDGVYAAPTPDNPNRFAILMPNGYPAFNPKTGKPITFDPMQLAAARQEYDGARKEAEVRASQQSKAALRGKEGLTPWHEGKRGPSLMRADEIEAYNARNVPTTEEGKPFPAFLDFLQDHRTKKAQGK